METNSIVIASAPSRVLDCMLERQVKISEALYQETRERLVDAVGHENYFSGTIAFPFGGVECRLTIAVIAYRRDTSYPEGDEEEIRDLVPVWWEFHTMKDGEELPNNFLFSELRKYL